jgi:flagellar assembly protein FliH
MSSKISVSIRKDNGGLKVKSRTGDNSIEQEPHEEVLRKQNAAHYQKGYEDGQAQIKKELENVYTQKLLEKFNELHLMFSDFDEKVNEYSLAFEKVVIELSINIAEKIIKREVELKSTIAKNLKDSMKKVLGANDVFIRLNPDDFDMINNDSSEIFRGGNYAKIKFEADERIEKGGCFVETEIGNVDSRISSQLNEINKQLEATYAEEIE